MLGERDWAWWTFRLKNEIVMKTAHILFHAMVNAFSREYSVIKFNELHQFELTCILITSFSSSIAFHSKPPFNVGFSSFWTLIQWITYTNHTQWPLHIWTSVKNSIKICKRWFSSRKQANQCSISKDYRSSLFTM